nr:hypothetical protein [Tanacetum cinerariifolium]
GPGMPLLDHMLNQGEPAFVQAQQQEVSPPPPSPIVAPHPSSDPVPSPPTQSSPLPIPFSPAPSSGVASTETIPDIPSSSRPSEPEISPTTLDAVRTLSQSKARARAATIIYKCIKKKQSSSGLDFTDAAIPAASLDSAGRVDSAIGQDSAGRVVSAGGVDSAIGRDSAGRVIFADGVDSPDGLISVGVFVAAGPTVPAEPSKVIAEMKAKAKREKPMTPAQ